MTTTKLVSTIAGLLGCLLFCSPAHAQAANTFIAQASGTVTTPAEAVTFSGPIQISSTIVTDAAGGPPTSVVNIDARQLAAVGATSGTVFLNSGQANLTRPLVASDVIQTTISFFPSGPGGFLKPRTAVLNLTLTYDLVTGALTAATASIATPTFR